MSHRTRTGTMVRHTAVLAAAVMGITALAHKASAADLTWNGGGGDANWTTAANWGGTAPVGGEGLIFGGAANTSPINNLAPNTLFDRLEFAADASAFTLGGAAVNLNSGVVSNSTDSHAINLSINLTGNETFNIATGSVTVNGTIGETASSAFTKSGGGLLVLGGTNVWTGKTNINGGSLRVANVSALPATNIAFNGGMLETTDGATISNSLGTGAGQFDLTNSGGVGTAGAALTVNLGGAAATLAWGSTPNFNPGTLTLNRSGASAALTLNNPLDLRGGARTLNIGSNIVTLAGGVTDTVGGGGITKSGSTTGTLVLNNGIAFTGGIGVGGGALVLNNVAAGTYTNPITFTGGSAQVTVLGNTTFSGAISGAGELSFPITNARNVTINLSGANSNIGTVSLSNGVYPMTTADTFGGPGVMNINRQNANGANYQVVTFDVQGADRTITKNVFEGGGTGNPYGWTITGSQNLTLAGTYQITAGNVWFLNNLPSGKTFTFDNEVQLSNSNSSRFWRVGGSGKTIVNGNIVDSATDPTTTNSALTRFFATNNANTGILVLNSNSLSYHGGSSLTLGTTIFNRAGVLPSPTSNTATTTNIMVTTLGGVAYAGGMLNGQFLGQLSGAVTTDSFATGSLLILNGSDAALNVDFTTAPTSGKSWGSMGLGVAEGAFTYTGTLTPLGQSWRLGGGGGSLTFTQQLVDRNAAATQLVVMGGGQGTLILTNPANNYTGSTAITYFETLKNGVDNAVSTATSTLTVGNTNASAHQDSAVYDLAGFNQSVRNFNGSGKLTSTSGAPTFTANPTITSGTTNLFTGIVSGSLGFNQNGPGTITLKGVNTYTGTTTVAGTGGTGLLIMNGTQNSIGMITGAGKMEVGYADGSAPVAVASDGVTVATFQIDANAAVTVRANGTNTGTSKISALTLAGAASAWTSKLNITDNALVVQSVDAPSKAASLTTLVDQVKSGRNGGTWDGNGITSSSILGHVNATMAVVDNADLNLASFGGQSTDANSVIITRAIIGDADLSGVVDLGDFNRWFSHVGASSYSYGAGDFDLSGIVDLGDFNAWFSHVGVSSIGLSSQAASGLAIGGASAVPEPASLAVLALGGAALLGRRRRSR